MKFSMGVMGVATFILSYTFAFLRGWQLAAVMSASIPVLGIVMGTSATFVGKMATRSTEPCERPAPHRRRSRSLRLTPPCYCPMPQQQRAVSAPFR